MLHMNVWRIMVESIDINQNAIDDEYCSQGSTGYILLSGTYGLC